MGGTGFSGARADWGYTAAAVEQVKQRLRERFEPYGLVNPLQKKEKGFKQLNLICRI
jgi:hypothetical protein